MLDLKKIADCLSHKSNDNPKPDIINVAVPQITGNFGADASAMCKFWGLDGDLDMAWVQSNATFSLAAIREGSRIMCKYRKKLPNKDALLAAMALGMVNTTTSCLTGLSDPARRMVINELQRQLKTFTQEN